MVFFQLRLSEGNQFINSSVIFLFEPYPQLNTEEYMYFWDFSLLYAPTGRILHNKYQCKSKAKKYSN